MLSTQDRENIMGWAYVWLKDAAWTNTRATYCDVEPVCCDKIAKIWFLMCLIRRSVGVIPDSDIELLYQRLQCLIGLSTVTTCPENCFPCQDPDIPTPTPTDCTLQVGSGCCDYSVEGIELQTGVCITIPEVINVEDWGDTSEFSIGFQFGDDLQTTWFVNFSEPFEQITSAEIIAALELVYGEQQEVVFTYQVNGNTICIYPNIDYVGVCFIAEAGFLNNVGVASTAITDTNLCSDFVIDGQYENTDELCANAIENTCVANDHAQNGLFVGLLTFQVLINGVWTDVTDEVENGTWQRINVCDDTITEWRILDSEDNVINSGEVTATCEGATEVTDSVCNWLQAHQTAIEQLQAGGGGLTCETIGDCEVIQTLQQDVVTAQETADGKQDALGFTPENVANKSTSVVTDQASDAKYPSVKAVFDWATSAFTTTAAVASQITAALTGYATQAWVTAQGYITSAALNPLVFFSGTAGHTGNTDETIVQTISVASSAWATNAVYQILARVTRASGTVTFRVRMNTTPDLTGSPITILEFGTTTAGNNPNRLLIKTGNSFEYSTLTTITDLSVVSTTATATMSTAGTIYIMLTIQGSAGSANGAFTMLNIARQ